MIQSRALDILKTGANVFLTGEPGAGKTYVLNQYLDWLHACNVPVAITASTGIASTHIGGTTIHSWSGIGARDTLTQYDLDKITQNEKTVRRIKKARVLVIDEISMLDGRMLEMVEVVCRTIQQKGEAFGGMQVVLVGDFFQLPPIAGRGEVARFAFESHAWEKAQFLTCYLTEQHRQDDMLFLGLLSSIRRNDIEESHYALLSEQTDIAFPDIEPTKLFTHNRDVDAMNSARLNELKGKRAVFKMEAKGNKHTLEMLVKNCLSPEVLELRIEAMVMCTKNNFEAGYVNGTLGRVVDFDSEDGFPIIETSDARKIKMLPQSWSVTDEQGKVLAEIIQVPLRLAWAITVHKSQGMSLDAAEIDLRNAFTYGQGYVAISRVRSLAGMKMIGLNAQALLVDPRVVYRDGQFRSDSDDADTAFDAMEEDERVSMQKSFIKACGGAWHEGGHAPERAKGVDAIKKESTYAQTKACLEKGMRVAEIARERKMAPSTIWTHIEQLVADGDVTRAHTRVLIPNDISWNDAYQKMCDAMDTHGIEKLKPIYEALNEVYEYDLIRLGRVLYMLERGDAVHEDVVF